MLLNRPFMLLLVIINTITFQLEWWPSNYIHSKKLPEPDRFRVSGGMTHSWVRLTRKVVVKTWDLDSASAWVLNTYRSVWLCGPFLYGLKQIPGHTGPKIGPGIRFNSDQGVLSIAKKRKTKRRKKKTTPKTQGGFLKRIIYIQQQWRQSDVILTSLHECSYHWLLFRTTIAQLIRERESLLHGVSTTLYWLYFTVCKVSNLTSLSEVS